jgi:hypothetical protein
MEERKLPNGPFPSSFCFSGIGCEPPSIGSQLSLAENSRLHVRQCLAAVL